jgi:ketosteroid isomerase-like protein
MSQENVELVRRAFEAWHPVDSETFRQNLHVEFEYRLRAMSQENVGIVRRSTDAHNGRGRRGAAEATGSTEPR